MSLIPETSKLEFWSGGKEVEICIGSPRYPVRAGGHVLPQWFLSGAGIEFRRVSPWRDRNDVNNVMRLLHNPSSGEFETDVVQSDADRTAYVRVHFSSALHAKQTACLIALLTMRPLGGPDMYTKFRAQTELELLYANRYQAHSGIISKKSEHILHILRGRAHRTTGRVQEFITILEGVGEREIEAAVKNARSQGYFVRSQIQASKRSPKPMKV